MPEWCEAASRKENPEGKPQRTNTADSPIATKNTHGNGSCLPKQQQNKDACQKGAKPEPACHTLPSTERHKHTPESCQVGSCLLQSEENAYQNGS